MIEEGMEVVVYASGTDKVMRKRLAASMATQKLIDPLTYYEDNEVPNPKERTRRLMMFTMDPQGYMAKYVMDLNNTQDMAEALNQETQQISGGNAQPIPSEQPQENVVGQSNNLPPQGQEAITSMV